MDVDLVADLREGDVPPFVQAMGEAFYADTDSMREAVDHRRSFNLIRPDPMFKKDECLPCLRTAK